MAQKLFLALFWEADPTLSLETRPSMHVGSQWPMVGWLPTVCGQHPGQAKGQRIIFS